MLTKTSRNLKAKVVSVSTGDIQPHYDFKTVVETMKDFCRASNTPSMAKIPVPTEEEGKRLQKHFFACHIVRQMHQEGKFRLSVSYKDRVVHVELRQVADEATQGMEKTAGDFVSAIHRLGNRRKPKSKSAA